MAEPWYLYLIECCGGTYYAGITNDVEKRYLAHAAGRGARYTRAHPPRRLLAAVRLADRSMAAAAEARLKRQPRHRKLAYLLALASIPVAGASALDPVSQSADPSAQTLLPEL